MASILSHTTLELSWRMFHLSYDLYAVVPTYWHIFVAPDETKNNEKIKTRFAPLSLLTYLKLFNVSTLEILNRARLYQNVKVAGLLARRFAASRYRKCLKSAFIK